MVVTISGLSLRDRGGNTCRRSARRGARDAGSCPFSGSISGTGIDDAKRARSSEVSATCGVGCAGFRRSSHLASEAVASKRLGGATTAKVGVGGCTNAVAVRAPGALYALVAGAMHMLSFLCFLGAWSSGRVVSGCCEGTEWHSRGSFAWPNANKRTDFASWRSFTGSQTRRPITNRQGTFIEPNLRIERRGRPASRDELNGFYWRFLESWTTVWFFAFNSSFSVCLGFVVTPRSVTLAFHLSPPKPSSTRIPLLKVFFCCPPAPKTFFTASRPRTARHPTRCPRLKPRWRRTRR